MEVFKKINEGLTNLGFTLFEAIMESIDDSLDGNANKIDIELFEEEVEIKVRNKYIKSNRISYIIKDNGNGVSNLEDLFNFGAHREIIFKNKDEYENQNGIFHYGLISHLNVGIEIQFYSKQKEGNWKTTSLKYDEVTREAFIEKTKEINVENLINLKTLCRSSLSELSGTVIYVKGVSRRKIEKFKEKNYENKIEEIKNALIQKLSVIYRSCLQQGINIKLNNIKITPNDIFFTSDELPNDLRVKSEFAKYTILLKELIERLDDDIIKESIFSKFKNIFSNENELLNEKILIRFFKLSHLLKDKKIQQQCENNGYLCPSSIYSGIYIKRNNRYIGNPAKIEDLCTDHDDFNRFRGEIIMHPVFDSFLGIQINKNRYTISNVLQQILKEKVMDDYNLNGQNAHAKLNNYISKEESKSEEQCKIEIINNTNINFSKKINKLRKELKELKKSVNNNFFSNKLISEIDVNLNHLKEENTINLNNNDLEIMIKGVEKQFKAYKKIYKILQEDFIHDYQILENRIKTFNELKKLVISNEKYDEKYEIFSEMIEPENEAEMFGILYLASKLFPNEFDFKILQYNYTSGIDCIIELDKNIFNQLFMEERLTGKIEDIPDVKDVLNKENLDICELTNKKISFLELKMNLSQNMNHSLRLVSHIVCWEKPNLEFISTSHVKYDIDLDNNIILYNNTIRVKIICLKELIENISKGKFQNN